MIIKKYTYTDWMKGKNFVLTGLGMNYDRDDKYVSEIIEQAGGIIRSSTVLATDYLVYDAEHGVNTGKYERAKELNEKRGKHIKFLTLEQFNAIVNDKTKGEEKQIKVGSVICLLSGDQTKCWTQELKVVYSSLPLEDAKRFFEIYNISRGEYARAVQNDVDTSYSGLYGLDDEILAAREKMKTSQGIDERFLKAFPNDEGPSYEDILDSNSSRYSSVDEYFEYLDKYEAPDFEILPILTKSYYWIDLCKVSKDEYGRYTSELHHVYHVAELFDPDNIPFDLDDPATVSIFGTNKFEAFADLSYGC